MQKTKNVITIVEKTNWLKAFFETQQVTYQPKVGFFVRTDKGVINFEVMNELMESINLKVKVFGMINGQLQIFLEVV